MLWETTDQAIFSHAGRVRSAQPRMGWHLIRLPETHQLLWVLMVREESEPSPLVLLTNVPIHNAATAQQPYSDWRLRSRIEHGYRFDQEQGLDVEDRRVRTLERIRRLFALVLIAAQFVFVIATRWPHQAVRWLRKLGGKFGLKTDRDGPYLLLRGLSAIWQAVATLSWLAIEPFPHYLFDDG